MLEAVAKRVIPRARARPRARNAERERVLPRARKPSSTSGTIGKPLTR